MKSSYRDRSQALVEGIDCQIVLEDNELSTTSQTIYSHGIQGRAKRADQTKIKQKSNKNQNTCGYHFWSFSLHLQEKSLADDSPVAPIIHVNVLQECK